MSPHRPQDADGLAEFASVNEATRSLLYFQTSGSEGAPKWVGLTRAAFLASARGVNTHLEATEKDRWLIALPLHHVGGFSILARCHKSGATFYQHTEKWDAHRFVEVCAKENITLTSLVPTQVFDLVQEKHHAPKSLRAVVVGGGALNKELGTRAVELGWPLLQSYGMTETASQIATEPLDHLFQGFDPDCLEVLPIWNAQTDVNDRLTVRGVALASGYALTEDGNWKWQPIDSVEGLQTRDYVSVRAHGARRFLRVIGREVEMVKVLGELVNIATLQKRLEELAMALGLEPDASVIWPLMDERKGMKLILAGTLTLARLEELSARFNITAQGFERLDACRQITSLPRTVLGKLDRAALGELLGRL